MLRGGEHGHIHSNFRNDTGCGKRLNTRHCHNGIRLRKVFFSGRQDQEFQIELAQFEAIHVRSMMWSFSACSSHTSPSIAESICSPVAFIPLVRKVETFAMLFIGFSKILEVVAEAALPHTCENTLVSLMLEMVRQF